MIAFPKIPLHGCRLALVCILMAVGGCTGTPELRIAGQDENAVSIVEGKRLLEQGRAVDAVAAFRRHLRAAGPSVRALNGLGIAYAELGRADLAAEMFSRALAIAPDDPATLNNVGFAALRRADAGLARHYLQRAHDRNRDLDEIGGNLERLALLEAFERRPRRGIVLKQVELTAADEPPTSRRHVASRNVGRETAPTATPSGSPPTTMIDFAALVDPFAAVDPLDPRSSTTSPP